MNKEYCNNPNVNMYDIEYNLNIRWAKLFDKASDCKFDSDDFFDVLKDTHRIIKKYDRSKMIPHSALLLQNNLEWFKLSDYYIERLNEYFCATEMAGLENRLLSDGLEEDMDEEWGYMYDIEDDLCRRWELLFEELVEEGSFDNDAFRNLCADTYSFIEKYDKEKMIPRATLKLSSLLNDFSTAFPGNHEKDMKNYMATEIAGEFREQMLKGLICENDKDGNRVFVVDYNLRLRIDALSFDLDKAEKDFPQWVYYDDELPF